MSVGPTAEGGAGAPSALVEATVASVARLTARDVYEIWLEAPTIAERCEPGQFVGFHLGREEYGRTQTIRRPFSIAGTRDGAIRIVFKRVGRVTSAMSDLAPGDRVSVVGPLGTGFAAVESAHAIVPEKVLVIAGGVGIAPILFYIQKMLPERKVSIVWGARTVDDAWYEDAFLDLSGFLLATEDGSSKYPGRAVDYMFAIEQLFHPDAFVGVGPKPMLQAMTRALSRDERPVFVSLETYMGCGLGGCCSCLVRGVDGWKKACVDGPVFLASEIEL
jgi:dihydroorotate dehydrogenase electron transfer subunit